MMDCVQATEPDGTLELTEVPVPDIGPTDVLVEVEATSVGLTVYKSINIQFRDDPSYLPRIPGHEIVGRVVDAGDGVTGLDEGDLVGAYFYLSCDRCDACRSGHEPHCENLRGHVGVDIDGGYAEYVRLPAANAISLPDGLDPVAATAVPDAIATPYHVASQRAQIGPGDRVMVLGAGGGVGIHLVQMAQYFGGEVTAVDQRDDKLERCVDLGATRTINTTEESIADLDASFDIVVDFTGSMALVTEALDLIDPLGRFVNVTAFPDRSFDLAPRELVRREFDVRGSRYCSKYELRQSAELVADGTIDPVITRVVNLADVATLLDDIAAAEVVGRGAVTP